MPEIGPEHFGLPTMQEVSADPKSSMGYGCEIQWHNITGYSEQAFITDWCYMIQEYGAKNVWVIKRTKRHESDTEPGSGPRSYIVTREYKR